MTFTVGDTAPPLTGACQQTDTSCGTPTSVTPANLAGAAVKLRIDCAGVITLVRTPITTAPADGAWEYDWQYGDLSVPGVYSVEAQVTYGDGKIQTFGPASFRVKRQVG